jgi:hypothetical protein
VEFTGEAAGGVLQRLQDLQKLLRSEGLDFRVTRTAATFEEAELLWSLPARVVSLLASLRGESRPLPFVEDIALPRNSWHPFCKPPRKSFSGTKSPPPFTPTQRPGNCTFVRFFLCPPADTPRN